MDCQSRQILFNGPMVQAILDGRKTQTRRVINPQPSPGVRTLQPIQRPILKGEENTWVPRGPLLRSGGSIAVGRTVRCPYGTAGDRLWVREAWRIADLPYDDAPGIQYRVDGAEEWHDPIDPIYGWDDYKYEAWFERMTQQLIEDCEKAGLEPDGDGAYSWNTETNPNRWRPSIHLPRWASRITLEVTGVRVERVWEISAGDAMAEGVGEIPEIWESISNQPPYPGDWKIAFSCLWDSINAKRGYGWEDNPYCWVITFSVV